MAVLTDSGNRSVYYKAWQRCLVILLVFLLITFSVFPVGALEFRPDQIKAAFIYNLINFVDWRDGCARNDSDSFTVVVINADRVARNLEIITRGERIQGKKVVIKRCASNSEVTSCDLLFLGSTSDRVISNTLEALKDRCVLTVGDSQKFTRLGGMVGLVRRGRHIMVEINLKAAREAGIRFSSKLLKIARIVQP